MRKIEVLNLAAYEALDYKERERPNTYYIRSYLRKEDGIPLPPPRIVCHCLKPYCLDDRLKVCAACQMEFHSMCSRHESLCGFCQ